MGQDTQSAQSSQEENRRENLEILENKKNEQAQRANDLAQAAIQISLGYLENPLMPVVLGYGNDAILGWVQAGELTPVTCPHSKKRLFLADDIREFIKRRKGAK